MDKSPDAFRTISEVAEHLDTPAHVLRFWESRFPQIRPVKRAGGRRYYRPSDVALLTGIKRLLHDEGLTIRGVQKILRDHGIKHVAGLQDDSVAVADLGLLSEATVPAGDETAAPDMPDLPDWAEAEPVAASPANRPTDDVPPTPAPRRAPVQPPLPLFDTVAAAASWQPREDVTVAALIRALPRGALTSSRPAVAALAGRLTALRARMVERAEGGAISGP
jgi:DNA-binding transcriptional MerR regulator